MVASSSPTNTPVVSPSGRVSADAPDSSRTDFDGVLVLAAPESGCRTVGSWLESSGYFPVNTRDDFWSDVSTESPSDPPTLVSSDWTEFLLAGAEGSWELPPSRERLIARRSLLAPAFELRLRDAVDCAHGMPLVVSDESVLPLLPALGDLLHSRFLAIFLLRNPLSIARALSAKYDIAVSEGLFLWEHYAAAVFAVASDQPVLVFSTDDTGTGGGLSAEAIETIMSPGRVEERIAAYDDDFSELEAGSGDYGATSEEFLEIATRHQADLWAALVEAAGSRTRLQHFPERFERPSAPAIEILHDGARHRNGRVSRTEYERLRNEGRASYEVLTASFEDQLSSVNAKFDEVLAERDQLRDTVSDLMARLRTMGVNQAEGHRKAERLSKELDEMNERLVEYIRDSEELHRVYQSESWRIGYAITSPVRRMKKLVFGSVRGSRE